MNLKTLLALCLSCPLISLAGVEFKSHFFPSFAQIGFSDLNFSSHNTLLVGYEGFSVGGYAGYSTIGKSTTDSSVGAALRLGTEHYFEIQGGSFERRFKENSTSLKGKGLMGNLIYGYHFNSYFGLALILSGKQITSGSLDDRTIVDFLPYLSLRVGY